MKRGQAWIVSKKIPVNELRKIVITILLGVYFHFWGWYRRAYCMDAALKQPQAQPAQGYSGYRVQITDPISACKTSGFVTHARKVSKADGMWLATMQPFIYCLLCGPFLPGLVQPFHGVFSTAYWHIYFLAMLRMRVLLLKGALHCGCCAAVEWQNRMHAKWSICDITSLLSCLPQ